MHQFSKSWAEEREASKDRKSELAQHFDKKGKELKDVPSTKTHGIGTIQATNQYQLFKMVRSNREIDKAHVRKLKAAITKKNLLHLNPIVINERFEVIDGQHRLTAAKELKLPIYYTQDASITENDIAGMNSNKRNWNMMDYINFYAVNGNKDFLAFNKFCNKHPDYKPSLLQTLCSKDGARNSNALKEGRIDISNIDKAEVIIGYIEDFKKMTNLATQSRFIEAIRTMASHPQYDHERMMTKVNQNPTAILPCANNKQYIQLLQAMFNKHVREDNIVIFLKR